jgi:lysyl-tRNA synthetase class 2
MSSEDTLIQIRKDKHQEANGGTYPLAVDPSSLPFINHTSIVYLLTYMQSKQDAGKLKTTIVPAELGEVPKYSIHGRITAFRKSGAITFIKVTDSTGSVQLIVSKAAFAEYDGLKLFDLGDIVEAGGVPCLSKSGERSLLLYGLRLLTKAHRPPPEKFAGIADEELKYRKRYLDLMSSEESRARFTVRTYIIRAIRQFMEEKNFLEVETSTLNSVASGANAKPFMTHHNALDIPLALRIAPELYLKRLLVGGLDRVYEIGRNYRNEGIDTRHNPEFTMMESYQAYGNFKELIAYTKELLIHINPYCQIELPEVVRPFYHKWYDERPFTFSQFVEMPMSRAVVNACDKASLALFFALNNSGDLESVNFSDPNNTRLQKIDVKGMFNSLVECQSTGEKFAVLFEYVAEPFLTEDYRTADGKHSCPVFITQFPKEISPLARSRDNNSQICDRFELYVEGRELANAFQELNDPDEQALRFQEQLENNSKDPMAYDADYVEALEHGMPPAIGFGMGIDRLVMLLTNTTSIKDVILFPTLRPEK